MTVIHRIVHVAVFPITLVVDTLHCLPKARIFKKKRHAKLAIGSILIMAGPVLAAHPVTFLPHFVWEGGCWLLHGYGALPVIKLFCEKYDIEHLDEKPIKETKKEAKNYEI